MRRARESDIKYAWAAYKTGKLNDVDPIFVESLSPEEFEYAFTKHLEDYQDIWLIEAEPPGRDIMPIGYIAVYQLQPEHAIFFIGEMIWFPWASDRNIVEGVVGFFNTVRNQIKVIAFASPKLRPLYEYIIKYGIMRRMGKSRTFFYKSGEDATMYETIPIKES